MGKYRFERLDANNIKDLVILYADSFGIQTSVEFLLRKYDTGYAGHSFTGFLAYDEFGFPSAYYGVFPSVFAKDGVRHFCAQSGDTMTHSLHRKKGLFVELAKETFALCKSLGIEFIFGFPNANSLPGFMKLGWKHDHDLNMYRVKIRALPLAKIAKKYKPFFGSTYEKWLTLRLRNFESKESWLPNSAQGPGKLIQIHNQSFFKYKAYFKKFIISTGNAQWYVRFDGRMFIGDLAITQDADFKTEFDQLKKISRKCGANEIEIQCSPGSKADVLFKTLNTKAQLGISCCYLSLTANENLNGLTFTLSDADTF